MIGFFTSFPFQALNIFWITSLTTLGNFICPNDVIMMNEKDPYLLQVVVALLTKLAFRYK